MRVLITGGQGQLGRGLSATAPADAEIVSHDVDTLDITDAASVRAVVEAVRPELVLNAAAYTAVDKAESEGAVAVVTSLLRRSLSR